MQNSKLNKILFTLCIAEFLVMQIWYNFSAVLSSLKIIWKLNNFQAGLIVSMFQLGYVGAVLFFSFLSDNYSSQKIFIVGSLIAGISSILFALLAKDFLSALLFRTVCGIGMGGVYTPGMKLLAEVFPTEQRGKAIGIYVSSLVIGSGASFLLSGMLVKIFDWQTLIIITSVGALFGAIGVYFLGNIPVKTVKNTLTLTLVKKVISKPRLLVNASYMAHMWELYSMWPWIGPFMIAVMEVHGYSAKNAQMYGNIIAGISIMLGSIATWLGGTLSDKYGRSKTILVFLLGSIVCSFTIGWIEMWPIWFISSIAIIYGFLVIGDSPIFSTAITELVSEDLTGLALGIQSVMGYTIASISPVVFGFLLDFTSSWGIAFSVLGIGALAGPIALWHLRNLPESRTMAQGKG